MTIASSYRVSRHIGNDSASSFSYNFPVSNSAQMRVVIADDEDVELADLSLGVDFSVNGIGAANGGTIQLINNGQDWLNAGALKTGYAITIRGATPLTQDTSIRNGGPYNPAVVENTFDRITKQIQELIELSRRAILFPVTSTITEMFMPKDLQASSAPFVKEDLSGFEWITRAELTGPAGATGPAGPQGPQGDTGPQGPAGSAGTWAQELLSGVYAAGNTTYNLSNTPLSALGVIGILGAVPQCNGTHFTVSGQVVTFTGQDTSDTPFLAIYQR